MENNPKAYEQTKHNLLLMKAAVDQSAKGCIDYRFYRKN